MTNSAPVVDPKLGIKETKEVVVAVNELAIILLILILDGLQFFKDIRDLINHIKDNEDFRNKIQDAVDGIKMVPAEVKDIDSTERVELVGVQIPYLPKILAAIKTGREKAAAAEVPGDSG